MSDETYAVFENALMDEVLQLDLIMVQVELIAQNAAGNMTRIAASAHTDGQGACALQIRLARHNSHVPGLAYTQ